MSAYPGADFSTFLTDSRGLVTGASMDLSFTPVNTADEPDPGRVIQELILRKLQCPPGSMDDPNWGVDLRTYLNASMTSADLAAVQAVARTEILKEEYVEDATVTCLLSQDGTLIVDISLTDSDLETYAFAFQLAPDNFQAILDVGQNAD